MTVLILAGERDLSADAMVRELGNRDVPVFRVDTAWFPQQLSIEAEFRAGRWEGRLTTAYRVVELEGVRSVWYRTPSTFQLPPELTPTERQHAHNEAKLGLGGVLTSLRVLWINNPRNEADAAYKPVQLTAAAQCGLSVPDTLITNEADAVRRFISATGASGAVTKMLGAPAIMESGGRRVAYTERLHPDDLEEDLRGIEVTAHQFQQWVGPKSYEARVVVVGTRAFTVAIHAQTDATRVDWRRDYTALCYEIIDPPEHVLAGVHALMEHFGLVYGALDFVITAEGWTLLEINAGGQYGWLEELDTVQEHFGAPNPITSALADLLAKGAT
jgi:ATP-grasp ribosomal peptide maturase